MSLVSGASPAKRNLLTTIKRGATIVFKIGAPRSFFRYADAITVFSARVRSINGDDTDTVTLTLDTAALVLFDSMTPARAVYGTVSNIPLALADYGLQRYNTHPGGPIQSVAAVYDRGVTLTAGSGYTVNTATGQITLTANPAGEVTADVVGFAANTIRDIAAALAAPYLPVLATFPTPTGAAGYFLEEAKPVADALDDLALSCGAFWMVNDSGQLEFRLWAVAGAPVASYSQILMLGGYTFVQADDIYASQPYLYNKNWTVQNQVAAGANAAHANYAASPGTGASVNATGDGSATTVPETLTTYFVAQADALVVATRICLVAGIARFIYTIEVPLSQSRQLGDTISLQTNSGYVSGLVISRAITAESGIPTQTLEALV